MADPKNPDLNSPQNAQAQNAPDRSGTTEAGTPEEAWIAATHDTEEMAPQAPPPTAVPVETTGRPSDDSWRKKKSSTDQEV